MLLSIPFTDHYEQEFILEAAGQALSLHGAAESSKNRGNLEFSETAVAETHHCE